MTGAAILVAAVAPESKAKAGTAMYGLISEIRAAPDKRDELAAVLVGATENMSGCLSYVIAADPAKSDVLWVTEVWTDKNSHAASLSLPAVQDTMLKGRHLIAGFASRTETIPLGGVGLPQG